MTQELPSDRGRPPFTVIIPAHNEEQVIGHTLRTILAGRTAGYHPRVIVVCNGCTDSTASTAREVAPDAEVIELKAASKIGAINEGLARTRDFPVVVVDADIAITPASLDALAAALREPGVMAASPAPKIDATASDWWTRAYYRVWERSPYLASGVGGSGVYGLSRGGAEHLGRLPPVIGDDTFVRRSFALSEQRRVTGSEASPVYSRVTAPARLGALLACEARWQAGNLELRSRFGTENLEEPGPRRDGSGPRFGDRAIHLAIKVAARILHYRNMLSGRARHWHRDSSRR